MGNNTDLATKAYDWAKAESAKLHGGQPLQAIGIINLSELSPKAASTIAIFARDNNALVCVIWREDDGTAKVRYSMVHEVAQLTEEAPTVMAQLVQNGLQLYKLAQAIPA